MVGGEGWQEKVYNREELKEAPENGKELLHSAHANAMNEFRTTAIHEMQLLSH
jgi:hypothetical protein